MSREGAEGVPPDEELFLNWCRAVEDKVLADLTFAEVRKALQALSSLYVQRRGRISKGHGLDSRGKRAAFALFYSPIHFLQTQAVIRALGPSRRHCSRLLDLGCGMGAAGAAWGLEAQTAPRVTGMDLSSWALEEAAWTYRFFGIPAETRRGDASRLRSLSPETGIVAAFTLNEINEEGRRRLLGLFRRAVRRLESPVLILEPISRRINPWFEEWAETLAREGARCDDWRFRLELPEAVALLDKAAGLTHRQEITCRSISFF